MVDAGLEQFLQIPVMELRSTPEESSHGVPERILLGVVRSGKFGPAVGFGDPGICLGK